MLIREQSIKWWNSLNLGDKLIYSERYFGQDRLLKSLTGREIQIIFEGVGDKYLKNKYNIVGDFDKFNKEYNNMKRMKGTVIYSKRNWKIIKNPESLKYFSTSCRGVITLSGDLYLETHSDYRIHNDILKILYEKGILKGKFKKNWGKKLPQESGFLTVQRYKDKNVIAIGESNKDIYNESDWEKLKHYYNVILKRAEMKNPDIIFSNKLVGIKFQGLKNISDKNKISENIFQKNLIKFDFFK